MMQLQHEELGADAHRIDDDLERVILGPARAAKSHEQHAGRDDDVGFDQGEHEKGSDQRKADQEHKREDDQANARSGAPNARLIENLVRHVEPDPENVGGGDQACAARGLDSLIGGGSDSC